MNVYEWKDTSISATDLPALIYRDRQESKEKITFSKDVRKVLLEIEVFGETTAQIRECLAEIETAIYTDETWGGLALSTEIDMNEMEIEHKEDYFCASKISIAITYLTSYNNPYA